MLRADGCGRADIWATRQSPQGWAAPANLGCVVNSNFDEAGPFLLPLDSGTVLYFSSTRTGSGDIYVAPVADDGTVGTPSLAPGLNTSSSDARPNLRRDGLEIFFDSNRPGGQGLNDLWTATRSSTDAAWSTPTNLGPKVNSTADDLRPSLSWDATTLYFGSTRTGSEGGVVRPLRHDAREGARLGLDARRSAVECVEARAHVHQLADEDRGVPLGVAGRLGFAQRQRQVHEVGRLVALECRHELLVVDQGDEVTSA